MTNEFASKMKKKLKRKSCHKIKKKKKVIRSNAKCEEAKFVTFNEMYDKYLLFVNKLVFPLKHCELSFLENRHLRFLYSLLKHCKLIKFITYSSNCYRKLLKMFYANSKVGNRKVSNYVMNKKLVIDVKC